MKIHNQLRIPLPPDEAWVVLNDVPRIAGCAPGAELLEQKPDGSYVGTVSVRLGPVLLNFRGTLSYKERDEANRRVVAEASGNETRARGTARANVVFALLPDPGGTLVNVDTDLQLAGSIAQYGRGAALIQNTAQVIMDEFARNLASQFESRPSALPTDETSAHETGTRTLGSAPATQPISIFRVLVQGIWNTVKDWFGRFSARDGKSRS